MARRFKRVEWPDEAHKRVYLAVLKQGLKPEDLLDVAEHGAQGGFPGFTYYTDTVGFYDENADGIWEMLEYEREAAGASSVLEVIAGFGAAESVVSDATFKNLMSWYALEAVARLFADAQEE